MSRNTRQQLYDLIAFTIALIILLINAGCVPQVVPADIAPSIQQAAPIVEQAAPVVAAVAGEVAVAAPEVVAVGASAYAYGNVVFDAYKDNCVPKEAYTAMAIALQNNPKLRVCDPIAGEDEIPGASGDHHSCHDDCPANPDSQQRWKNERERFGKWGQQDWLNRPTDIGQTRCNKTTLNGKIIRVAIFTVYKITSENVKGDMVVYLPHGLGQVTSFSDARFKADFMRPPRDLADAYGESVQTNLMNCYDLESMGLTIPPAGQ